MKTGDRGAESKIGATASDQNNHGCLRRDTTLDHIQTHAEYLGSTERQKISHLGWRQSRNEATTSETAAGHSSSVLADIDELNASNTAAVPLRDGISRSGHA